MHHQSTIPPRFQAVKLCECGCGQPTRLPRQSDTSRGMVIGQPVRFIAGHQLRRPRAVYRHQQDRRGYIRCYVPDHPAASKYGHVYEHRLVMEQAIGRYLRPDEEVHHRDENKGNNALENLELLTKAEHRRRHLLARKSRAAIA